MPVITASIDPITRIEGHLKVDVKIGPNWADTTRWK